MDLVGPIQNSYILTFADYYTSYPEAVVTTDISAATVIRELTEMFAWFGYPMELATDNGSQFVGQVFEYFLMKCGIKHTGASLYYPRSIGKIEWFHRYLKKAFMTAESEGKKWSEELPKILVAYRSTPHRASGETPAKLMFGRDIRTNFPNLAEEEDKTKDIQKHHRQYICGQGRGKAQSWS